MKTHLAVICLFALVMGCNSPPDNGVSFESQDTISPVQSRFSTGGVSLVDVDGDGDIDIYEANGYDVSAESPEPQRNILYLNDGAGTFGSAELSGLNEPHAFSSGSTWADFDNDGDLDVYIPNQQGANIMLRNDGGTFEPIQNEATLEEESSYSATWVDVDADGWLDLYVGNGGLSHLETNSLYRNDGGRFEQVFNATTADTVGTVGEVWADFNGDTLPDLYLPNRRGSDRLYVNQGNWQFDRQEISTSAEANLYPSGGAAAADFDNDGDMDIVQVKMFGSFDLLLVNDGNATFAQAPNNALGKGGNGYGASWVDVDNDGWTDLYVWNWGSTGNFYRNHSGELIPEEVSGLNDRILASASSASADLNGDGLQDIVVANWPNYPGEGEQNHVYYNTTNSNNNWVSIRFEETGQNRMMVGSRVEVHADGKIQTQQVRTQSGWRSQGPLDLHFGVGSATSIDKIVVQSPAGDAIELSNVSINGKVIIRN